MILLRLLSFSILFVLSSLCEGSGAEGEQQLYFLQSARVRELREAFQNKSKENDPGARALAGKIINEADKALAKIAVRVVDRRQVPERMSEVDDE